jgi:uncharacterized hydrophobic protein (TIGR00271 family)
MASSTEKPQASAPNGGLEARADARPDTPLAYVAWWWRTRHRGTTTEERRRVIDSLFSTGGGVRTGRFWAMQAMAIVIATMGLSANSAAVVIGAMLVAPLMTPIMAVATALALGWPQRAIVPLLGTVLAAAGSIVLAWGLHSLVTTATVTEEILARTSPDLRDLLVALAAGAAGALGTARQDVSAALPGVAVAVALVPPLATVGACLELGRTDLASGAFLLFATNLVAIVLAGIVVLLWCGFVPARLIQRGRVAVWGGTAATLALLVAVGVPLTLRTVEAAENAEANRAVTEVVIAWLAGQPDTELEDLTIRGQVVRIDVTGPGEPTDVAGLTRQIASVLGEESTTTVRWSVRATADPNATDPDPEPVDPREDDLVVVRSVVDTWAADEPGIDVVGVSVGDTTVVVDVVGERAPTTVRALADSLRTATGRELDAEVRFSQRLVIDDDPVVDRRATIAAAVARALGSGDVQVDAVRFREDPDGRVDRITVDLGGSEVPDDPAALVTVVLDTIAELDGFTDDPEVVVRFTERRVLPLVPDAPEDGGETDDAAVAGSDDTESGEGG